MFDGRARHYNIHRSIFERKSIRRCVTYYFEIEIEIEAKLVFGAIRADNHARAALGRRGETGSPCQHRYRAPPAAFDLSIPQLDIYIRCGDAV